MAKKIAFSSNHIVIDLPYGKHVKVHKRADAEILKSKFEYLAKKFNVTLQVYLHDTNQPAGRGIGPLLETKEAFKVLEQQSDRPIDLEEKALTLAGMLLDMCLKDSPKKLHDQVKNEFGDGKTWATYILTSGHALKKMREIIAAQGGDSAIISAELVPGRFSYAVRAKKNGDVKEIDSKNATIIAKILGAPGQKESGLYLHKKAKESVKSGEVIVTLYSESQRNLEEAKDSLSNFPILSYA
jgi:thymidine phosphorylase